MDPGAAIALPGLGVDRLAGDIALRDARGALSFAELADLIAVDTGEPALAVVHAEAAAAVAEVQRYDAYGASEFQVIVANGPGMPVKPGSMGRPHPGVPLRVLDGALEECAPGEVGTLALKADDPALFLEYRKQPDSWREATGRLVHHRRHGLPRRRRLPLVRRAPGPHAAASLEPQAQRRVPVTRMPALAHNRPTSCPMPPAPTTHTVLPCGRCGR